MSLFLTSDSHFSHARIIENCNRPFASTEEMDAAMIERWNSVVKPEDNVLHLGDMFWCQESTARKILKQLNGKIFFILGNHNQTDDKIVANPPDNFVYVGVEFIGNLKEFGCPKNLEAHLYHFKVTDWDKAYHGSIHAYGHVHNNMEDVPGELSVNLCVENWNYTPASFDQVREFLNAKNVISKKTGRVYII